MRTREEAEFRRRTYRVAHRAQWNLHWVLVLGLNLLSIGLRGYQYDVHDQHSTVPVLKRSVDPALYPRDLLLTQQQNRFSLFDRVMAWPARWVGVEWAFFGCYLLVTSVSSLLLWKIARAIFLDDGAALLATAACLCIFAAIFADPATVALPLVVQLHLETARRVVALFAAMYLGGTVWRFAKLCHIGWQRNRRVSAVAMAQALGLLVLLAWLTSIEGTLNLRELHDPDQSALMLKWALPYLFLIGPLLPRKPSGLLPVYCAGLLGAIVVGAALLAGLGVHMLCAAIVWAGSRPGARSRLAVGLVAAFGLGAAVQCGERAKTQGYRAIPREWIRVPGSCTRGPKRDLTEWMRTQSPVDALFVVPPHERGIRIHGERSLFVTWKEGGPVLYSKSYAKEWSLRMTIVDKYERLGELHFLRLARAYGVDYAVTYPDHDLPFPTAYANDRFCVYHLRPPR